MKVGENMFDVLTKKYQKQLIDCVKKERQRKDELIKNIHYKTNIDIDILKNMSVYDLKRGYNVIKDMNTKEARSYFYKMKKSYQLSYYYEYMFMIFYQKLRQLDELTYAHIVDIFKECFAVKEYHYSALSYQKTCEENKLFYQEHFPQYGHEIESLTKDRYVCANLLQSRYGVCLDDVYEYSQSQIDYIIHHIDDYKGMTSLLKELYAF